MTIFINQDHIDNNELLSYLSQKGISFEEYKRYKDETKNHIEKVGSNLSQIVDNIKERALVHDQSKLEEPEMSTYIKYSKRLRSTTYGSKEYKDILNEEGFKDALNHHYQNNSHHPEYYPNGILDMSLLDILEMLADWKAACEKHDDGDFSESMKINRKRFNIPDELYNIMYKTVKELGWL